MLPFLGIMTLFLGAPPGQPATGPESPYRVAVCLRLPSNPALTPLFADSTRRQVRDQLANFFGPLADVQVFTSGHWLLDEYVDRTIDVPPLSPDLLTRREVRGKVFLVGIDFRDSVYHVSWRQVDGAMQHVGPVRSRTTPDRQWVPKAICLAVKDDFALVAEVQRGSTGRVGLKFRGGEHQANLVKLLAEESIWQPFWVMSKRGGTIERRPAPYTVIRVSREQLGQPEVVSNSSDPFPQRKSIVGVEAIKLNTCRGRLRLRLVDPVTGAPVINCSVSANDKGFDSLSDADQLERPNRQGYVVSRREFQDMAYVKISTGGAVATKFPLPITSEWCEYEVKISADKKANEKNDFERMLRALAQDLYLIDTFQSDTIREFNELNGGKRYEEALKRVSSNVASIQPSLKNAQDNLALAQRQARDLNLAASTSLQLADKQFAQVDKRNLELGELQKSLEAAIMTRQAQDRANVLIKLGQQAEREGDIDEAIARYELALGEQPNQPTLREKLTSIKKIWDQKSPARELIYERWAKAELTEIATLLPEVEKSLPALQSTGDHLTAQKLLAVNSAHVSELSALVEQLSSRETDEDKKEATKYNEIVQRLAAFQERVGEYLDQALAAAEANAPAAPPPTVEPAEKGAAPATAPPLPPKSKSADEEEEPIK